MTMTGPATKPTRGTTTTPLRIPRQVSGRELLEQAPPPPVLPPSRPDAARRMLPRDLGRLLAAAFVVLVVLVGLAVRTVTGEAGEAAPKELKPQVAAMFDARATLMSAERAYAPVMATATKKIDKYLKAKRAVDVETSLIAAQNEDQFLRCQQSLSVSCPFPSYPEQPKAFDAGTQVTKLRAVAATLKTLRAEVARIKPVPQLAPAHAQLIDVVQRLESIAGGNASVLAASVLPPTTDGPGYVNTAGLKKLAKNTTPASIRQMDQTVIGMLNSAGLPMSLYPV